MKVFISYRREDSAGHTGRLYDTLRAHFGDGNVFLDVSGIDSGRKFADVIQGAIHSCDVLLAIIGPEWLTCVANGRRRIDDPGDLVRTEILTAFTGNVPVIPVLVGGAAPPPVDALPAPLKPLAALDAHDMTDQRWAYDADRLREAIHRLADGRTAPARSRSLRGAALAIVAILIGVFLVWRGYATNPSPQAPSTARTAAAAATFVGEWNADVTYEWGAKYTERLKLSVDRNDVSGTASFLGTPRAIVCGVVDGDRITFETRSEEVAGDFGQPRDVVHRYRGRIAGTTIAFSMQSDGGSSQEPVAFTATRTSP